MIQNRVQIASWASQLISHLFYFSCVTCTFHDSWSRLYCVHDKIQLRHKDIFKNKCTAAAGISEKIFLEIWMYLWWKQTSVSSQWRPRISDKNWQVCHSCDGQVCVTCRVCDWSMASNFGMFNCSYTTFYLISHNTSGCRLVIRFFELGIMVTKTKSSPK